MTAGNPENPGNIPENPGNIPAEAPGSSEASSEQPAPDHAGLNAGLRAARAVNNGHIPGGRREYDWEAIKRRYIEGVRDTDDGITRFPFLEEVAQHFGVVANRVREKAALEGWRGQRTQWQAQLEATRRQARAAAMSKEAVNVDGRALDAAKMGLQLAIARLAEIGQQAQKARSDAGVGGSTGAIIDAQEQQRLAQAVDLWHRIGLRAVGDPELHRVELTGPNGAPLEIGAELRRDNPERLAGVLGVLAQAGLGDLFGRGIVDGEVVPAEVEA